MWRSSKCRKIHKWKLLEEVVFFASFHKWKLLEGVIFLPHRICAASVYLEIIGGGDIFASMNFKIFMSEQHSSKCCCLHIKKQLSECMGKFLLEYLLVFSLQPRSVTTLAKLDKRRISQKNLISTQHVLSIPKRKKKGDRGSLSKAIHRKVN